MCAVGRGSEIVERFVPRAGGKFDHPGSGEDMLEEYFSFAQLAELRLQT